MMTTEAMQATALSDVELVAASLAGNREAFRQIVERYQTLVSSLAYSAVGDVSQSQDLAQETFVTAWKKLAELREPANLRPWLCGITRFLISKEFRRQDREPVHAAEPLAVVEDWADPEPLPPDQAISNEEKRILWRSLERIPEIYREPLVLFYREHQSIETVARDLGLSEAAVKQRLARGRKLLQEEFLAFVASALEGTTPGKTFTLSVLAALPVLVTTATAATVTAAATKGGSAAQATAGAGMWGWLLTGGGAVVLAVFGLFVLLGHWVGRAMGRVSRQTVQGRQRLVQFWRTLAIGFIALVVSAVLVPALLIPRAFVNSHSWITQARAWSISAFCWLVVAALVLWECRRRRDARRGETPAADSAGWRACQRWVRLGMIGPTGLLVLCGVVALSPGQVWSGRRIDEPEAHRLISERRDAQFKVLQYQDGSGYLKIILPEDRRTSLSRQLNPSLVAALRASGVAYQTGIEGKDFPKRDGGGQSLLWLLVICAFITGAGIVQLLARPDAKNFSPQAIGTPRAEGREMTILAVCAAVLTLGVSVFLLISMSGHAANPVSAETARRLITENRGLSFYVFQYHDGSKKLMIWDPSGTRPGATFAADEPTLALLAEEKIPYETHVQGREFGVQPSRGMLAYSIALAVGAVVLLCWGLGIKPFPQLPEPASEAQPKS